MNRGQVPAAPAIPPDLRARLVEGWRGSRRFADPLLVAAATRDRIPRSSLDELRRTAEAARRGSIRCFDRWVAPFGEPIDWHRDPVTGFEWDVSRPGIGLLHQGSSGSDVKFVWELGRFPHAFHLARAAAFFPRQHHDWSACLSTHVRSFIRENPLGYGIHWASGQETAFRVLAWVFAADALLIREDHHQDLLGALAVGILEAATYIGRNIEYARQAVYNNHLISEALGLFAVGVLFPQFREAGQWVETGHTILEQEAERQFYHDGGYIQQSHNYHRLAVSNLQWAWVLSREAGRPPEAWTKAIERSLDYLLAHQNIADGRLPNYGANDGAHVSLMSGCDFSDMRPVLQTASLMTRGERLYEPGPWDEAAAWLLGPEALDAPLRPPNRVSVSFPYSGHHVLRGRTGESFCAFRCGTLRDRFSQIDMLHLDVWWRGQNVLVDGGSYLYNGPQQWHNHFMRTASHNTVTIDGHDQMVHFRKFKVLYWTKAHLLRFEDQADWALCAGEHYGFRRYRGGCVHRRCVLFLKDDVWIVVDTISGTGRHAVRLHWLGGPFEYSTLPGLAALEMRTPKGPFQVNVFDERGVRPEATVVCGREQPPRGWLARYYGEKLPVPSLAVVRNTALPFTLVSVLAGTNVELDRIDDEWRLRTTRFDARFRIGDGVIHSVAVNSSRIPDATPVCVS